MEFGVFAQLFVPRFERDADPRAEHQRIMRNVDIAVAADRNGFKYVWCAEHHFLDEYSTCPAPRCSWAASWPPRPSGCTSARPSSTSPPPVNHPARVAENVALLDHLFDNRFEFGTGRGSSTTEVFGFDIETSTSPRRCGRRPSGRSRRCGRTAPTPTRASTSACRSARCSRSRTAPAPRHVGGRRQPPTFGEAGEMGLGVPSASPPGAPAPAAAAVATTRTPSGTPRRWATTSTTTSWA
jgi:alkanesulfonate monooxygenase SsuD/methylene tetrahydromethanopterin reductase-like flavin-dependent oxidoreductase (luciferase family)